MRGILRRMSLSIILILSFCIGINISVRAESSTESIKQMLSPYDEWFDYIDKEDGEFYYKCPKMDIKFEEMFNYVQDFHFLLQNVDYVRIGIQFDYSPTEWPNYEEFSDYAWTLVRSIKYGYGDKCVYNSLGGSVGAIGSEGEYKNYHLIIEFKCASIEHTKTHESGDDYKEDGIIGFSDKAYSIIQEGKKQSDNDLEMATYLCNWVKENIHYSNPEKDGSVNYDSASTLLEGHGVCDGQSGLLYDLFTLAGIPVAKNINSSLNHAWNSAYLDGVWYTFDVLRVVRSRSNNYINNFFFTDSIYEPDNVEDCKYAQNCMITPQAFINIAKDISIKEHETYDLQSHVRNLSANAIVTYSSSDLSVVTVDYSGTITANNKGSAIITVNVLDRGNDYTFNQVVNVSRNGKKTISKLKIKAKKNSKKIEVSTLKGSDISISANRKIFRKGKKKTKKISINNCKGKSLVKLSGKLKEGDEITVKVSKNGYKTVSKKIKIK